MRRILPDEAYKEIYDYISNTNNDTCFDVSDKDYVDGEFDVEFWKDNVLYNVNGTYRQIWKWCDTSFDHAFGTYHDFDVRFAGIEDIDIDECSYYDDDRDEWIMCGYNKEKVEELIGEMDV